MQFKKLGSAALSTNEYLPLRMEKLEGRDYLVAPVVMIVEGILTTGRASSCPRTVPR